ncbi:hatching enzyme 1.2-like [Lepisosteus oculatus]|uniref:hatching enzyme 1.2-like n=1 Tax=Lepisosteus oculatus TaxID=7918 RepID=UPI0035F51AF8
MELLAWIIVLLPVFQISASPVLVTERVQTAEDKGGDEVSAMEVIINVNSVETMPFTSRHSIRFTDIAYSNQRSALICPRGRQCFWPKSSDGAVYIPYVIDPVFSVPQRVQINQALSAISTVTCIVFTPRSRERDYLNFRSLDGCWSSLGRTGGQQDISLSRTGCVQKNIISHEMMHALGFIHEHNRGDRDRYIKVLWDNITPGFESDFVKRVTNNLGTPYDYDSILHYKSGFFAKHSGLKTLVPIPDSNRKIGQSSWLTKTDILKINRLYECKGESKSRASTQTPTTKTTGTTRRATRPVVGPTIEPNTPTGTGQPGEMNRK